MLNAITLKCGHTLNHHVLPAIGSVVYCLKCNGGRVVVDYPGSYFSRCRSCKFTRNYGADLTSARRGAARHCNKLNHDVDVILSERIVHAFEASSTSLPGCDLIPF